MSAVEERALDFKSINPDLVETSTGRKIKQASATRWVWQPFKDIDLFDNLGPAVINNLTAPGDGPDGQPLPVTTTLKRCQPYPLTNCEYEVPIHEVKRYNELGTEIPDTDLGAYAGANPQQGGKITHVTESKFAYSAARELSEQYAKEYGLVVLEPLTGNEDSNVVRQVFEMVQPMTYRLHALDRELTDGAKERIRKSTHPKEVKALAEACRKLMLKGVTAAKRFAGDHMADFSRQIQLATGGHKGNRAFAAPYDEFVAEQLGVEVPRVVQTQKTSNTNDELLARLAERELAKGDENAALNRALALLEEERAERKKLAAKVDQIVAAQKVA
jgi:hypothetical protein